MRVLTIMGSPKKNGKTNSALKLFENNIKLQGHEFERINITDYSINGCLGCYACMASTENPGCIQKDDAQTIFEKIMAADSVVFASPLYSFGLTAQLKPLVDRHFCLSNTKLLDGKRMALLITCAGQEEHNADLVQEFFRRGFDGANGGMHTTKLIGEFVIPFSNEPDFTERASETADRMAIAV